MKLCWERSVFTLYPRERAIGVLQDAVVYSIDTFDEFLSSDYVVHLLMHCMKSFTIPCTFSTKELQSRGRPGTSVTCSQRSPFRSAFGFEKNGGYLETRISNNHDELVDEAR